MLSLKDFMRRSQILKQYRQFLKLAKNLDQSSKSQVIAQIRGEYRAQQGLKDATTIKQMMAHGSHQFKILDSMVSTVGATASGVPDFAINVDEDDPDVKGRVGTGWPWGPQ